MTPIERACRALCELDGHPPGITMDGKPLWMDYLPEVRAVIAAIREPSEAMEWGRAADRDVVGYDAPPGVVWQEMIDALMEEAP